MPAPSLAFGTGDWELAGWYMSTAPVQAYGSLFASSGGWATGAVKLSQYGTSVAWPGITGIDGYNGPTIRPGFALQQGRWYYLRAGRAGGQVFLLIDEQLIDAVGVAQTFAYNFALLGYNNWDTGGGFLNGRLVGWSVRTTGIAPTPGAVAPPPAEYAFARPGLRVNDSAAQQILLEAIFNGQLVEFNGAGSAVVWNIDDALQIRTTRSVARVAHSAPIPPCSAPRPSAAQMVRDVEFGGSGSLEGTTMLAGRPDTPTKARVRILRQRDLALARQVWSDPVTGKWRVDWLDTDRTRYVALAEYPGNPDDPATEGYLRPVAGVSPLAGGAS